MRFYLSRTGQPEGPFEEAALVEMIKRGEVTTTAHICAEGQQAWQPLSSHPPFAAAAAPPAAAPPAAGGFAPASPQPATPAPSQGQAALGIAATMAMDSASLFGPGGIQPPGQGAAQPGFGGQPGSQPGGFGAQPGSQPGGFGAQPGSQPGGFGAQPWSPAPPGSAGGAMAPAAPAQKNKNLPLIIGGGCALLFFFSLCASSALFFILRS